MSIRGLAWFLALSLAGAPAAAYAQALPEGRTAIERVVDLPARSGAPPVRVLVATPPNPVAVVILQAGGDGILNIRDDGRITALGLNQLVRSRAAYVAAGFAIVVPDIPADLRAMPNFLAGPAHATDLGAVVAFARSVAPRVAFVATSNGAVSAAALMTLQTRALPDAVVITSGLLVSRQGIAADRVGELGRVRVPVLLLSHVLDACPLSEPNDGIRFAALLTNAPKVDRIRLSGGSAASRNVCEFDHYHGFNGMDGRVVETIDAWLRANAL